MDSPSPGSSPLIRPSNGRSNGLNGEAKGGLPKRQDTLASISDFESALTISRPQSTDDTPTGHGPSGGTSTPTGSATHHVLSSEPEGMTDEPEDLTTSNSKSMPMFAAEPESMTEDVREGDGRGIVDEPESMLGHGRSLTTEPEQM